MDLDFSKCKTKVDVEKVFKKKKREINIIKDFEKRVLEDERENALEKVQDR